MGIGTGNTNIENFSILNMMRKPLAVANEILRIAGETDDSSVTPMQLIKLAYLSHGWMLGLYGRPLLDESIEAWRFGPVVRSIYAAVKGFKDKPVIYPIKNIFGSVAHEEFSAEEKDIIKQVYNMYGKWDGISLSGLTHQVGTPWDTVWRKSGQNAIVSNDLIENHFREKYRHSAPN